MRKLLGKKANPIDVIFFTIKMLVMAIALILVGFFMLQFGDRLEPTILNETETGSKAISFIQDVGGNRMPTYFVTLFAFDIIGIIVTSFLITLSPVFFILYIIFVGFAVILAVFSENFYGRMAESDILASYIADQGMINFIMTHATTIILVVGAISAIIIMAKVPGSGGRQDI